jgi:hypothetical protein
MWHFYWRSIRRIPSLAVEAVKRIDTFVGILTICVWVLIGGTTAGAWWQELPWQVPVALFTAFLIYGFLRAVYLEHLVVEKARDATNQDLRAEREAAKAERGARQELEKKWADRERRKALKTALQHAQLEGKILHDEGPTEERASDWAYRVAVMISVALDAGEVGLFYNDFEVSVAPVDDDSEVKQAIRRRLNNIRELQLRVDRDSLEVSPDFHAREWIVHRPPRINMTPQTHEVSRIIDETRRRANQQ